MKYDYDCAKCGTLEIEHPMAQDALTDCPECGGPIGRLVTGGNGFALTGGGWYSDGYSSTRTGSQDKARAKEVLGD